MKISLFPPRVLLTPLSFLAGGGRYNMRLYQRDLTTRVELAYVTGDLFYLIALTSDSVLFYFPVESSFPDLLLCLALEGCFRARPGPPPPPAFVDYTDRGLFTFILLSQPDQRMVSSQKIKFRVFSLLMCPSRWAVTLVIE